MTVTVTLKQLKNLDACEDQLKLFEEVFGESVSFKTKAQAIKVAAKMAHKFDFDWASNSLLKGDYRKAYYEAEAPLWEAYEEAIAPLLKAYLEAEAPLLKDYLEAEAPLLKAYLEAEAPLLKDYLEAEAPLREAYLEALAKEFAKCYFDQEEKNHS